MFGEFHFCCVKKGEDRGRNGVMGCVVEVSGEFGVEEVSVLRVHVDTVDIVDVEWCC